MGASIVVGEIIDVLKAQNHLLSHQNAAIDLLAADKRAAALADIDEIARLCKNGEILEIMDYGDQISIPWSEGTNNYTPALNLCHETDAELEDSETIHGAYFEWDKTTPTGVPFDEPEAIYYADGTESAGNCYIEIKTAYGNGWVANAGIQITLTAAMDADDQLVIDCGKDNANNPTSGRNWYVYAKGSTVV